MINLVKQDELKQLPDEDYQQWCHDLMIIKRVVTAITSFKRFTDLSALKNQDDNIGKSNHFLYKHHNFFV